jgi:hypothetical protein
MEEPKSEAATSTGDPETCTIFGKVCDSHSPSQSISRPELITQTPWQSPHPAAPSPQVSSESPVALPNSQDEHPEKTIFYLAYGSNLSSETFLGVRGIKPLSQQNVHCPALTLTFDLPGIPYIEPCFANTRYSDPSASSPSAPASSFSLPPPSYTLSEYHKVRWTKGLVGVAYEVTYRDYLHIIATEGGGSSYRDIQVSCYPLPKDTSVVPPTPSTVPFIAHTLYCPPRPNGLSRPDPNYAQPSPRYLNLITSGAAEHGLPEEYREYLAGLRAYRVTTWRQALGKSIFVVTWMPFVVGMILGTKWFADEKGHVPPWYAKSMDFVFKCVWRSYDGVYKRLYGDGERTIEHGEEMKEEKLPLYTAGKQRSWLEREQDVVEESMG